MPPLKSGHVVVYIDVDLMDFSYCPVYKYAYMLLCIQYDIILCNLFRQNIDRLRTHLLLFVLVQKAFLELTGQRTGCILDLGLLCKAANQNSDLLLR